MENTVNMDTSEQEEIPLYPNTENNIPSMPSEPKARRLVLDALGFSLVGILLVSSFYWVPSIVFATYIFAALTTFTLFVAASVFLWKSNRVEPNKVARIGIFFTNALVGYVIFSVALGVIASSALSGLDFSQ